MYAELVSSYTNPLNETLKCNTMSTNMFTSRVTSAYRMCTQFNMDWIIIFSVPQWIYIGPMIIAICIALGISVLITIGGVIAGIVYSVKITKPFQNLIELFESVSRMELDFLNIKPSRFKEVSKLQDQFLMMTQRIKQYRAFIPSHLLHQLENQDQPVEEINNSTMKHSTGNNFLAVPSGSKRRASLNSATGLDTSMNNSSSMKKSMGASSNVLFKIGFEKRRVSSMVIYLDGFNLWVQNLSFNEITHLLTDIYEVLQKASLTNGAQIGNFENESVFLSWNSTERIKFHELKAAHTAATLRERMNQIRSTKWEQKDIFNQSPKMLEQFKVRFGILSQHAHCGNVGTKNSKSFTIIGSANNNLQLLMKKAKKFNLGIVITNDANVEISNDFHTRYVASTHLLNEDSTTSPLIEIRRTEKVKLYEVGESKSVEMDEWMYELQSTEQKNKWKMYNEACSRFFCDECEEALPLFREYLQQNNQDLPTLRMIEKCKKRR
ncbi:predicted protein [Naegleria gruberi]|uniref:Predicted protein n=1 Tax=Naegleria gruberi TaxID=5762 RepID=D2V505_NAEGR|nr:uncharacterized protein NAEGRDRAFT_63968 [Naegleria gruberi]EFC48195.1 predicted protein [Naegleria gruberi]|eukprot:XP_002680939.1 predicted protein [Naegleria gruberi strain NEG-M]